MDWLLIIRIVVQEIMNRQTKRSAPHKWQHINLCVKGHAGRRVKINAEVVGIQVRPHFHRMEYLNYSYIFLQYI